MKRSWNPPHSWDPSLTDEEAARMGLCALSLVMAWGCILSSGRALRAILRAAYPLLVVAVNAVLLAAVPAWPLLAWYERRSCRRRSELAQEILRRRRAEVERLRAQWREDN